MTMRLFFMATINIGANNGHGCNVQTTKESSLFHASFAFYFMPTIYIILPFPSLSSHRQHHCHHVQKTKQRSPVYFLPPSVTLQEKRNSKSLPLLSHSSKLLKHDYFSKTSCIQNKTQEKETLSTWLAKICRWRSQGLVLLQSLLPILPILTIFLVLRLTFAGKWVGQSDWISCLKLFCHLH